MRPAASPPLKKKANFCPSNRTHTHTHTFGVVGVGRGVFQVITITSWRVSEDTLVPDRQRAKRGAGWG